MNPQELLDMTVREAQALGYHLVKTGKLNDLMVVEMRELYATGQMSQKELAERYNITNGAVSHIITRKRWNHI